MIARLTAIAAALVLAACSIVGDEDGPVAPKAFSTKGIDVSYYQGAIDWHQVRADGVGFAYLKATEGGDRLDERFHENWRAAHRAGLHRGAYHFWYHCRPGREQAAWFIANVPKDDHALPPVLDMEWTPFSPTCTARPHADTLHSEMQDFLDHVEAHFGKRPVIYTSVDFYADRMREAFHDYHLWVRSVAGHPTIRYGNRKWRLWQYTATGRTAGIDGDVDHNVFAGSKTDFERFAKGELSP
ncbi:MAG TPA: GH25 family lysozyme [Methylomirabilota bacterium]|nr:GH25 family lysozyme [Methylomirabilota bacterium]